MKESSFPTKEVEELNEGINRLRNEYCLFLQSDVKDEVSGMKHEVSEVKYEMNEVKQKLNAIILTQTKDAKGKLFMQYYT
jgi:hypothetical protein